MFVFVDLFLGVRRKAELDGVCREKKPPAAKKENPGIKSQLISRGSR